MPRVVFVAYVKNRFHFLQHFRPVFDNCTEILLRKITCLSIFLSIGRGSREYGSNLCHAREGDGNNN